MVIGFSLNDLLLVFCTIDSSESIFNTIYSVSDFK